MYKTIPEKRSARKEGCSAKQGQVSAGKPIYAGRNDNSEMGVVEALNLQYN